MCLGIQWEGDVKKRGLKLKGPCHILGIDPKMGSPSPHRSGGERGRPRRADHARQLSTRFSPRIVEVVVSSEAAAMAHQRRGAWTTPSTRAGASVLAAEGSECRGRLDLRQGDERCQVGRPSRRFRLPSPVAIRSSDGGAGWRGLGRYAPVLEMVEVAARCGRSQSPIRTWRGAHCLEHQLAL